MTSIKKAVIMAGGEGVRLGPITQKMPKPLVPILNVPVMSRILRFLYRNGIREAAVTLKYRAQDIVRYYQTHGSEGVKLRFFVEEEMRGTAGGVKVAAQDLGSDFVVISGDAVCDFDLRRAFRFHADVNANATIVTVKRKVPLAFGGVLCGPHGEVLRFAEKPPWHGVVSDSVNTGIYVFDQQILSQIPDDVFCDFSKDVFPRLIGRGLYGFAAEGYWCDVGTPDAYYACNRDALSGRIRGIETPGEENEIEMGAEIARDARILRGTCAGLVRIGRGAIVEASILMDGVTVGAGAIVRSAIVCRNAEIGRKAIVRQGAVIGEGVILANGVIVEPQTRIDAENMIMREDIVVEDKIFSRAEETLFHEFGLAGNAKTELLPPFLLRCGEALASVMGGRGVFFSDGSPSSNCLKHLMMSGASCAGADCADGGEGFFSLASFSVVHLARDFAVYVKCVKGDLHKIYILDHHGMALGTDCARKVASEMKRPYTSSFSSGIIHEDDPYGDYLHELVDEAARPLRGRYVVEQSVCSEAFYAAATLLGAVVEVGTKSMASEGYVFVRIFDEGDVEIVRRTAEGGFETFDRWHAVAAILRAKIEKGEKTIFLPDDAPHALDDAVHAFGGVVIRCDARGEGDPSLFANAGHQRWHTDPILLALLFAAQLESGNVRLDACGEFAVAEKMLSVESASAVIGELAAHGAEAQEEGILLRFENACVRVTAENAHTVKLFSQAPSPREAEDAIHYAEKGIAVGTARV